MLRSEKQKFVSDLARIYEQSGSLVVAHYHGLTVAQITALRKSLKQKGAGLKVIKNTLSKIAANNSKVEKISQLFCGPTIIAHSEDLIAAAKITVEFAKLNKKLKIVGGMAGSQVLDIEEINQLAQLPSLDELRGKIVGILQAPATRIMTVLQAPFAGVARVLQAHSKKNIN